MQRWGCLEPRELVDKFWQGIISGVYVSHGEAFTHLQDIIWWAKGGTLPAACGAGGAFRRDAGRRDAPGGLFTGG